ncbi:unnamed protein product [Prunus armeniaca]
MIEEKLCVCELAKVDMEEFPALAIYLAVVASAYLAIAAAAAYLIIAAVVAYLIISAIATTPSSITMPNVDTFIFFSLTSGSDLPTFMVMRISVFRLTYCMFTRLVCSAFSIVVLT